MIVQKSLSFRGIFQFAGPHLVWLTVWVSAVTALYHYTRWEWITIPWLPLTVIGTAVAFYVGFKNNQAYDRLWEARKIWGSIVNSSRMWGSMVRAYLVDENTAETELAPIRKELIYRHIAWLYTLRAQLLVPTQWEHVNLGWHLGKINRKRRSQYGADAFENQFEENYLKKYLPAGEYNGMANFSNAAAQIIDKQSQELSKLHRAEALDVFKQMDLQQILNDLYDSQGKAERIKKFPLPRQYGSMSFIFVCIFIFLLPFGIVGEFSQLGEIGVWLPIPLGVLIGWVYVVMELIGDYSENPFEGLHNDVPMFSICRTIEIDLLQMLGEQDIPEPVKPQGGVLM